MSLKNKEIIKNLIPGVYSAIGLFVNPTLDFLDCKTKYPCAISIGWNPVYENLEKTIEVYIIHSFGENDFYGQELMIDLKSFIRAEALFSTFDDLVLAITCDVKAA